jgi:hypothetical protein
VRAVAREPAGRQPEQAAPNANSPPPRPPPHPPQVYDHILVNGPGAHPLYRMLKEALPLDTPGKPLPIPGAEPGAM